MWSEQTLLSQPEQTGWFTKFWDWLLLDKTTKLPSSPATTTLLHKHTNSCRCQTAVISWSLFSLILRFFLQSHDYYHYSVSVSEAGNTFHWTTDVFLVIFGATPIFHSNTWVWQQLQIKTKCCQLWSAFEIWTFIRNLLKIHRMYLLLLHNGSMFPSGHSLDSRSMMLK